MNTASNNNDILTPEELKDTPKEELVKNFDVVSAKELLEKDIPPMKWIVKDILPEENCVLIAGNAASFKSYICASMAVCVSSGNDFLKNYTNKGAVLIIDEENGERRTQRRLEKLKNGLGLTNDLDIHFLLDQGVKIDYNSEAPNFVIQDVKLRAVLDKIKPCLIIIDTITATMQGVENEVESVRKIRRFVRSIIRDYKCSIILLHHARKPYSKQKSKRITKDDIRGSGDFLGQVDFAYVINREDIGENTFTLEKVKERDITSFNAVTFEAIDIDPNSIDIRIVTTQQAVKQPTKADIAAQAIRDWIKTNSYKPFQVTDCEKVVKDGVNVKETAFDFGLKQLKESGEIKSGTKRGEWIPTKPSDNDESENNNNSEGDSSVL